MCVLLRTLCVFTATITLSTIKMAYAWDSPVFIGQLSEMIRRFEAAPLRIECETKGLIKDGQSRNIAAKPTRDAQNEALLDAVRVGDDLSFHVFLGCIRTTQTDAPVRAILGRLEKIDKFHKP